MLSLLVPAAQSEAQYIDFNSGTPGSSIGGFYSGMGVTFADATWDAAFGCCGVRSTSAGYNPLPGSEIKAYFTSAVGFVSLLGQDVGGDGFRLSAYDGLGNFLTSSSVYGTTTAGVGENFVLSVVASGIREIRFSQDANNHGAGDGMAFDDLRWTADPGVVPEPGTYALVATGLIGIAGIARRRRKA